MMGYPADTIIKALKKAFDAMGVTKKNFCGISSVKSNIGHLRYAAGSPGLIKAAMAIYNKILPPTANIEKINPKNRGGRILPIREEQMSVLMDSVAQIKNLCLFKKCRQCTKCTVCDASSIEEINEAYGLFVGENSENTDFGQAVFYNNSSVSAKKEYRLAICASSMDELKEKYGIFEQFVKEGKTENLQALNVKGIYFGKGEAVAPDKVAWMFPGQASQYPNMLKDIYEGSLHAG